MRSRNWLRGSLRAVATMGLLLLSIACWMGVGADVKTSVKDRSLRLHAITVNARVLTANYDPEGGDPDGWTTDRVVFRAASGKIVRTVVGHHGPALEEKVERINVVYDSTSPANASLPGQPGDDGILGIAIGISLSVLSTVGTLIVARPFVGRRKMVAAAR